MRRGRIVGWICTRTHEASVVAAAATLFSSSPAAVSPLVVLSSSFISLRRSSLDRCRHSRPSQRSTTSSTYLKLSSGSSAHIPTRLASLSIVANNGSRSGRDFISTSPFGRSSSDRRPVRTTARYYDSNGNDDDDDDISSSSTSTRPKKMIGNRVALLQLPAATIDKSHNIRTAREYILRATDEHGASLCILPEVWNSPYATGAFPEYAEVLPDMGDTCIIDDTATATAATAASHDDDDDGCGWGESATFLMNMAKMTGMYIVGGSIPEVVVVVAEQQCSSIQETATATATKSDDEDDDKLVYYNTCLIIDPTGRIVGKHRKLHLFDISIPNGGIQFKESDILSPGDLGPTYFDHVIAAAVPTNNSDANDSSSIKTTTSSSSSSDTAVTTKDDTNNDNSATTMMIQNNGGLGRIGIGICYDIRFPEYAQLLAQKYHCTMLIYPGAFNLSTGPAHWELLQRARAVDNQCFVIAVSPARTISPSTTNNVNSDNNEDDDDDDDDDDDEDKTKTTTTATKVVYPPYYAWGHSSIISPWGTVIAMCHEEPTIIVADLDMNEVTQMRNSIPTLKQKRNDLYRLIEGS